MYQYNSVFPILTPEDNNCLTSLPSLISLLRRHTDIKLYSNRKISFHIYIYIYIVSSTSLYKPLLI